MIHDEFSHIPDKNKRYALRHPEKIKAKLAKRVYIRKGGHPDTIHDEYTDLPISRALKYYYRNRDRLKAIAKEYNQTAAGKHRKWKYERKIREAAYRAKARY